MITRNLIQYLFTRFLSFFVWLHLLSFSSSFWLCSLFTPVRAYNSTSDDTTHNKRTSQLPAKDDALTHSSPLAFLFSFVQTLLLSVIRFLLFSLSRARSRYQVRSVPLSSMKLLYLSRQNCWYWQYSLLYCRWIYFLLIVLQIVAVVYGKLSLLLLLNFGLWQEQFSLLQSSAQLFLCHVDFDKILCFSPW